MVARRLTPLRPRTVAVMTDTSLRFAGRTALVTGSSRGLGAATAKELARQGADLVITYRQREDVAREVAGEIEALGRKVWVQQCDVGDLDDIDALFDVITDPERGPGRLDLLVANAAATAFRSLLDTEPRHLDKTFAISVGGFLRLVQRGVPLLEQSDLGRVVAVSGVDTVTWIPSHGVLAAAKAAMETMVAYLGVELGERGVTVVGVNPGWIDGDSLKLMLGPFYDHLAGLEAGTHPLRQTMSPDDVAQAVAMLCGDAAKLMNGSIVRADGAGVFSFCGRYINLGVDQALNALPAEGSADFEGAAPSVTVDRPT